jgi:hypothetical protein
VDLALDRSAGVEPGKKKTIDFPIAEYSSSAVDPNCHPLGIPGALMTATIRVALVAMRLLSAQEYHT